MIQRLLRSENSRGEARAVLIAVLCFIVALAALQASAFLVDGAPAFGQGSPTPTSRFRIQFINPTENTSNEVSNEPGGTDSLYHIVAWVNEVPPSPKVEFKLFNEDANREDPVGEGTLVGTDAYEFKWPVTGVADGTYELRAILFSSNAEVSRDTEEIVVNNTPEAEQFPPRPPGVADESQSEAVEITYPPNGGGMGWFRPNPGNGPRNTVMDATSSAATEAIDAFYTTSPPGNEPAWQDCNEDDEAKDDSADGIRCTIRDQDNPAAITAVALVAKDTDEALPTLDPDFDVADAHRAFPYEQDANTVEITPVQHQKNQTPDGFPCSDVITATVKDQAGRKIADINVDVHAAGPTDRLSFDDSGDNTHENKPPENHAAEGNVDCESDPPGNGDSQQGDHEIAGPGDTKHIESVDDTTDGGTFTFQLHSQDAGGTQFTVWADEDSNDRLCSAEAQADGSVGWNVGAPGVSGVADEESFCPRPGPTGSPSPTPTQTRTASPTGTRSPSPSEDQRTVTLAASRAKTTAGRRIRLAGQLFSPSNESCVDDEFIRITRRVHGTRNPRELVTTRTNEQGRYQLDIRAKKSADYQAVAPSHDSCAEAFSSPATVQVRVKIKIRASDKTPERGTRFKITVTVTPKHGGTRVVLQRKKGRRFVKVDAAKLKGKKAVFRVQANFKKRRFRASWRGQDDDHESNKTAPMRIKTHR